MEEMRSCDTSVLARATWRHIAEYGLLHRQHYENLKSYNCLCLSQ
jgi:hypothetical protein